MGTTTIGASLSGVTANPATLNVTAATLVSLQATPPATAKPLGLTQQFTAIGTYSDSTAQDVTTSVTWASSDGTHATITSRGIATTVGTGAATITATLGGTTSNATKLTGTSATLVSLQITPAVVTKAAGLTQRYVATGTYTDATTQDISSAVTWTSSDVTKASIDTSGLATTLATGATHVVATLNGTT